MNAGLSIALLNAFTGLRLISRESQADTSTDEKGEEQNKQLSPVG